MFKKVLRQLLIIADKMDSEFYIKNISITYNALFALIGFTSIFIPVDTYTGNSIIGKVLIVLSLLIIPAIIGFLYSNIYVKTHHSNKRKMKNGYFILEYGDLHQLMFPTIRPAEEYTVVIPVNNRLNTVARPWGSSGKSNHGYWLHTIIKKQINSEPLQAICIQKLKQQKLYNPDKNHEYPIGTCILLYGSEINQPNVNILLAATGFINQENQSDGNEEQFIAGLQGIIKTQTNMLYKRPMYLPIISGGFAGRKMNKKGEDLIEMMYQMFKFNESGISSDIHIVVKKTDNVQIF